MKTLLIFIAVLILCGGIETNWISIQNLDHQMIQIEIKGHVQHPGIYEVKRGTKLIEVLKMSGIFEDSDLSAVNGLMIVHDGDSITICQTGSDLIYLNTATLEELCTLPGIGTATAENIIAYRNEHLFQSIDELLNVKGIGEKKFEAIEDLIGL